MVPPAAPRQESTLDYCQEFVLERDHEQQLLQQELLLTVVSDVPQRKAVNHCL